MPTATTILRICIALAAMTATTCIPNPCPRDKPCLEWVSLGETYSVELVQHLELNPSDGTQYPVNLPSTRRPCGSDLDLATGNTVEIAVQTISESSDDQCGFGCFYVTIRPTVENLTILGPSRTGGSYGKPQFFIGANVRIGPTCSGSYEMSVSPVSDYFLRTSDEYVASNHILFRQFIADKPSACADQITQLGDGDRLCWDAWAVRIKDSSGKLVTKDLSDRPASGRGADAAVNSDDAGR